MLEPLFGRPPGRRVRVALPVPVDTLFDYQLAADPAAPGCRVLVPFRRRRMVGVVVEAASEANAARQGKLESVERVLDAEPVLSPSMLEILRDAAADLACPVGLALAAALPPGGAPRVALHFELTARGRAALASGAARGATRDLLAALAGRSRTAASLARVRAEAESALRQLRSDGLVCERAHARTPDERGASVRVAALRPGVDLDEALGLLGRAPRQAELLRILASSGPLEARALAARIPNPSAPLRALEARGLIALEQRSAPRDVLGPPVEPALPPDLTPDQEEVLKPISDAVRSRRCETFLLHGVTGSGKTEVYLRAIADALAIGRQALVLVPEITLTHQILARIRTRFGDDLAVLHSGLRASERLEQWGRLHRGATPIAVGARSALFAPLEKLGVIILDEEHDPAYKNEEGFRYHARDLARRRAAHASCPVLLGSATPCLETRFAADRGEMQLLSLPVRIAGRPLPAVQIVDLARERERTPRGRKLILTRPLRRAMNETLAEGGQVVLFLNRRGFSTQVLCFDCGYAERCRNCDIALVYHASDQKLRCHYCGFSAEPRDVCGGCGAPDTALLGLGTQRLEEEVKTEFARARVARLDRDTARRRGFTERVLSDLHVGRIDVLIGTQLVAKGHDYPGVRLVGVVAADIGLHLPDFRAAERTFQLLTQVAGRAGRDRLPGRVVLQTFVPEHYAIRPVREHDYETFYTEELGQRAALRYPPFGRLVHALVSAPEAGAAQRAAAELAEIARAAGAPAAAETEFEVLGPAPAPLARLRGRHRVQLLVKGTDEERVRRAARALAAASAKLARGVQASVDANPQNML